jgi:hypothetical protein
LLVTAVSHVEEEIMPPDPHDDLINSIRVKALAIAFGEQSVDISSLAARVARLEKWAQLQADWSLEVTNLLHRIDLARLATDYPPDGGGTNPPRTAPTWPPV